MIRFWGKVKKGKGRGKTLGFPTANIALHKKIGEGIYISYTKMEGKLYPSVTWIGTAKTFSETEYLSETFILSGYERDLYGKRLSISLLEKIRDNEFFQTKEALIDAMKTDIAKAKEYHKL